MRIKVFKKSNIEKEFNEWMEEMEALEENYEIVSIDKKVIGFALTIIVLYREREACSQ